MKKYFQIFIFLYTLFWYNILFGQGQLVFKKFKEIPNSASITALLAIGNHLYVGTNKGAYDIFNDAVTNLVVKDKNIIDFAALNDSMLYLTDGIKVFDYLTQKPLNIEKDLGNVTSIEMYNNQLYIGTSSGLAIYNKSSGRVEIKTMANSALKSNAINFIYTDSKGKCWIGTEKGEVRIDKDKWQLDHKDQNVTHIYENKEGIWFASLDLKKKRQLYLIDHFNRSFDAGYAEDLAKGVFNDFCIDNNGVLYFASDDFRAYDPYESKTHNFSQNAGYIAAKAMSTVVDNKNQLWLGTEGNGLYKAVKGDIQSLVVNCLAEKHPTCANGKNGAIKVIVDGGKSPYIYNWPQNESTTNVANNLSAGSYAITIFDQAGVSEVCVVDLKNPELFFVDLVSMSAVTNEADGRIEIQPIGGDAPYTYKWNNNTKSPILSKIVAGNYAITITDKNGCIAKGEYSLTKQKITNELKISNLQVGKTLNIEDLSFKADSSVILPESYSALDEIVIFLKANPKVKIEVGGHTNTIPSHEYCDKLSQARADSIAKYFQNSGVEKNRIIPKGYGKRQPIMSGTSAAARLKNQRVEIKFLEL